MNVFKLARDAGMLVVLDGRIGRTEYRCVHGTLDALERFAQALEIEVMNERLEAAALDRASSGSSDARSDLSN